jgi:hypothetical protein
MASVSTDKKITIVHLVRGNQTHAPPSPWSCGGRGICSRTYLEWAVLSRQLEAPRRLFHDRIQSIWLNIVRSCPTHLRHAPRSAPSWSALRMVARGSVARTPQAVALLYWRLLEIAPLTFVGVNGTDDRPFRKDKPTSYLAGLVPFSGSYFSRAITRDGRSCGFPESK